jgi:aspartate-semialdehyde dehydrogenase
MAVQKKKMNVAVVGATGAVGEEMLATLLKRDFPIDKLTLLASSRSAGKTLSFKGKDYPVEELNAASFDGKNIHVALFSAGADRSKQFAPAAVKAGAVVVDNSSAFRMDPSIPLIVPEVNSHRIKDHKGIIANPNCSTIIMVVAINPLHKVSRIRRVVVSTYQASSGAGLQAMIECQEQTRAVLDGKPVKVEKFAHQLAFNLIPHIDVFLDNAYTKEEMKMVHETRKIMEDMEIQVAPTCIRVPVIRAHSESVNLEFAGRKISPQEARDILAKAPGVTVQDDPAKKVYPMPLFVAGQDDVFVGRIRDDISVPNGLAMWVVGDQILKGAALNAVQIAELL